MAMKIVVTPEIHDRIVQLYQKNETIVTIAKEIGFSYAYTYKYIREHPEVFGKRKHIFPEVRAQMIEFWNEGHSAKEVAEKFNVSLKTVYNVMSGYPVRSNKKIKPASPQYDILRTNHDTIVRMWKHGIRTADIAKRYNVSTQYLYRYMVRNRESFPKRNATVSPEMHDELVKLWNSGCKVEDIIDKLHISSSVLYNYISIFPELFPKRKKNCDHIPMPENTKITPEVLEEISKMWNDGITVREISRHFKVSTQSIYKHIGRHPEIFPERKTISSEQHDKLVELWKRNVSVTQMAKTINKSTNTVNHYIDTHPNDFPRRKNYINPNTHDDIAKLWNNGVKAKEIAAMLGCSNSNVFAFVTRNPNCVRRGKAGINRELFIELWNSGTPASEIAKQIGIKKGTVYAYSRNFPECNSRPTGYETKREAFVKLWNEGLAVTEIADKLGIQTSTVRFYSRKYPGCIKRK